MESLYLYAVIVLFVLAITDLVVGVSNDAVNFLNSAIGSKVANMRTVLIIASLGVFIGAAFSSGMMEIARKGIFVPEHFYFKEIMFIFLATMITDIILLDAFNSFGMPTSTTVSIVFELLGASVIMAVIKVNNLGDPIDEVFTYINTEKAIAIIMGILLSVAVAFTIGALVQYFSRLLFSFEFERRIKFIGSIWAGLGFTILSYFMLIKGLKGASFVSADFLAWVKDNTIMLVLISAVFWIIFMQVLIMLKVNILKVVVLFGTFALAMAFAGNDLVNFIGVPIAGFESYKAWAASGQSADGYLMSILAEPVKTDSILLFAAGLVMVATLWTSKKARDVVKTSVDLSRQDEGSERFKPHGLARLIVRISGSIGGLVNQITPNSLKDIIESNFKPATNEVVAQDAPAFDLIRASVNLIVASLLIAIGTNMGLPLSTTYVSFMVAMGTSLSDRAWGSESAVYRVSGVLNVIGGWFLTAGVAFAIAGTFAYLLHAFGTPALVTLVVLAFLSISRTLIFKKRKQETEEPELKLETFRYDELDSTGLAANFAKESIKYIQRPLSNTIDGISANDPGKIKVARKELKAFKDNIDATSQELYKRTKERKSGDPSISFNKAINLVDYLDELQYNSLETAKKGYNHIRNSHKPLSSRQTDLINQLMRSFESFSSQAIDALDTGKVDLEYLATQHEAMIQLTNDLIEAESENITSGESDSRTSELFFTVVLRTRDLVELEFKMVKLLII